MLINCVGLGLGVQYSGKVHDSILQGHESIHRNTHIVNKLSLVLKNLGCPSYRG